MKFKLKPVKLRAPSGSGEKQLKNVFDVIFGTTLVVATLPLIAAASN